MADTVAEKATTKDLQEYEIGILYHPGLEVDLTKAEDKLAKIFADNGGKVTATDNWGKKKLLYPIKGNDHAVYVFYMVDLPQASLTKVESILNITDEVIRYLVVRIDAKEVAKAAAALAEKAKFDQKNDGARTSRDDKDSKSDDKDNTDEAND